MKIIRTTQSVEEPVVLMIGNYDGVHRGHQAIITRAKEIAEKANLKTAVLSFQPHPLKVLRPDQAPKLLQTPRQKSMTLAYYGVDYYVEQTFDEAFSQLSPIAFIEELKLRVPFKYLLVGFNFRFGHRRQGDGGTLRELSSKFDFEFEMIRAQTDGEAAISSSRIRQLLYDGDVQQANLLLGRPYFLEGMVRSGKTLGRKIGAPTANTAIANELMPKFGVYATWTRMEDQWFRSISNLGLAPTVTEEAPKPHLETHFLNFAGDLYDKDLLICFSAFIRPEQKFPSVEALRTQIQQDVQKRLAFDDHEPPAFPYF
jgi:riboflavin kinase/FMN adenylyltransferase